MKRYIVTVQCEETEEVQSSERSKQFDIPAAVNEAIKERFMVWSAERALEIVPRASEVGIFLTEVLKGQYVTVQTTKKNTEKRDVFRLECDDLDFRALTDALVPKARQ